MPAVDLQLQIRYQQLESVLASQRLEGLEPDSRTIEDLKAAVRGEITIAEVRSRVFKRIENSEL